MKRGIRAVAVAAVVAAASFTIHADKPSSHNADIQLQLAQLFFQDGRYLESPRIRAIPSGCGRPGSASSSRRCA